jgi:hypothetical protein
VRRFESELLDYMRLRRTDLLLAIQTTGGLPEGDDLKNAIKDFKANFQPTEAAGTADVSASTTASVGPETTPETLETE